MVPVTPRVRAGVHAAPMGPCRVLRRDACQGTDSAAPDGSAILVQSSSGLPPGADAAPVAQRIEHLTTDQKVGGSNTSGRAICSRRRQAESPLASRAARAASCSPFERRMQNSLPSGSASTTQPVPGPQLSRKSWTSVAPWARSRGELLVARALARHQVEVHPVLPRLALGHLDEQHQVTGLAGHGSCTPRGRARWGRPRGRRTRARASTTRRARRRCGSRWSCGR